MEGTDLNVDFLSSEHQKAESYAQEKRDMGVRFRA